MDIKSEFVVKEEGLLQTKTEQNDDVICIDSSSDDESAPISNQPEVDVEDQIASTYIIYKEPPRQNKTSEYFVCVVCLFCFTDSKTLESHLTTAHFFIKTIYVCPKCFESHTSKDEFVLHLTQHKVPYSNDFMAYECNQCHLSNESRVGMLAHVHQHFEKAKSQMVRASRFSETLESLRTNITTMRTRYGWATRRRHPLPVCRQCSKRVYRLRDHIRAAHPSAHSCFVCQAPVTKLEKHLRKLHFYSKPLHSCPLCEETFGVRKTFVAHLQSAHRSFPYSETYTSYACVHCGTLTADHRSAAEHSNRHFRDAGIEPTPVVPVGVVTCGHCREEIVGERIRCRGSCKGSYHLDCTTELAEESYDVDNDNWFCSECRGAADADEAFGIITDIASTSCALDEAVNDYRREAKRVKLMRNLTEGMKKENEKLKSDLERINNFVRTAKSERINNKVTRTVCNIVRSLLYQSD